MERIYPLQTSEHHTQPTLDHPEVKKLIRKKRRVYKKANLDELKDEAYRFYDRFLRSGGTRSVQQNWDLFTSKMNE